MAKPFVKWAGGKGKLLNQLETYLPADFSEQEAVTYVEPFVGGGAMLFHMLEIHPNIKRAVINDINPELILCYEQVKNEPENLIDLLNNLQSEYYQLPAEEARRSFFETIRIEYNILKRKDCDIFENITKAAYFIFLNKTCFNGLYRENRSGEFNVPFGRYKSPVICDKEKLTKAHLALQNVEMLCGDYGEVVHHLAEGEYTFFYFDPPYRPLLGANSFKDYSKHEFGDQQQLELHDFYDKMNEQGYKLMLSNSDSEIEPGINYFEQLFQGYNFHRVIAPRVINAFAARRSPQLEVLITNYTESGSHA